MRQKCKICTSERQLESTTGLFNVSEISAFIVPKYGGYHVIWGNRLLYVLGELSSSVKRDEAEIVHVYDTGT